MDKNHLIDIGKKLFEIEINELITIKNSIDNSFYQAITQIMEAPGRVVVVGIGKSAHISTKFVATLNSTGTPAQFLHASEAIHGDFGLLNTNDVVICLSKSGNTPEIKNILPVLKNNSKVIIAITGNLESELAKYADVVLDVTISQEGCPNNLAPMASTTAQLVMGDAIAKALMVMRNFQPEDFAKYHPGGALGKKLIWKVEDIIDTAHKPFVMADVEIKEVILSLSSSRYGITAVKDNEKIVGVITDGDLRRMLQNYDDFKHLKASQIMTANPKTIQKTTLAKEALLQLKTYEIGQLIVMDQLEYCGIIDIHTLINEGIEL